MTVTFDTGILVRASPRSSGPARAALLAIAATPTHTLAPSNFIIAETGRTLSYPRLASALEITSEDIHDYLEYLRQAARIVEPSPGLPVVLN